MIYHDDPRKGAQHVARALLVDGFLGLHEHRLCMTDKYRHPHAMRHQQDIRIQNFPGFSRQLPLFLGVTVIHEHVDMRDAVEGDLLGELGVFDRVVHIDGASLVK